MKKITLFLALIAGLLFAACGDTEPLVPDGDVSFASSPSHPSAELPQAEPPQTSNLPGSASTSEDVGPSSSTKPNDPMPDGENRPVPENVDELYLTALGDITGIVLEFNAGGFTLEGGVPQLSSGGDYATLIGDMTAEIIYTDETVFLYAEYQRATDESTVYMGNVEDVAKGRSVSVWGEYEGEGFVANAIRVVVFV